MSSELIAAAAAASHVSTSLGSSVRDTVGIELRVVTLVTTSSPARRVSAATLVRGFVYDAWPATGTDVSREMLADGERIVRSLAKLNAIPVAVLDSRDRAAGEQRDDDEAWVAAASGAVDSLLGVSAS